MYGRAEDEAVEFGGAGDDLVDRVADETAACGEAASAADASGHGLDAEPKRLRVDTLLFESSGHFGECREGAALSVRTAVDQ